MERHDDPEWIDVQLYEIQTKKVEFIEMIHEHFHGKNSGET